MENSNTITGNLAQSAKSSSSAAAHRDPADFEREFVHGVYARIAPHFSQTRHTPWPQLIKFLDKLPPYAFIVDCGCGNGKNMTQSVDPARRHFFLGYDRSRELMLQHDQPTFLKVKEENESEKSVGQVPGYRDFMQADVLQPALRAGVADAVISVAVLHHLSTAERREQAIIEMFRLLRRDGGKGFIIVWAMEDVDPSLPNDDSATDPAQLDRREKQRRKMQQRRRKQIVECDTTAMDVQVTTEDRREGQDVFVSWSLPDSAEKEFRYYHLFQQGELENLLLKAARDANVSVEITAQGYERQNWFVAFDVHSPKK